jgi:beta-N-acetylhexosaminidase
MAAGRKHRYALTRRQVARIPAAGVVALAAACAGCAAPSAGAPASTAAPPRPSPSRAASAPRPAASQSCTASTVLSGMSEAQRAGQLFLVGLAQNQVDASVAAAVRSRHFGSVVFGMTSHASAPQLRTMTASVQSLATGPATAGVRFFVAANQEGGQVQALQGPSFPAIPAATAQGTMPPSALQQQAATWGRELRSAGVNLNLAPVMDVVPPGTAAQNAPIGALEREFGSDPATVAAHGVAFLRGMAEAGVATTAKHFPGLGRVHGNTDFTSGVVDTQTTPGDPNLGSFRGAIDAGVPFVMIALATYTRIDPRHLAVFSPAVMETMLRQQMHFQGVIVSDDLGVSTAVAGISPASRAIGFLSAGGDLITAESLTAASAMYDAVLARAAADPAFRGAVDAAALRVLTAKQAYGLLPCGPG